MAGSADRDDPYASFNFLVNIQGIKMGFSEVSGLTHETNIIEYRTGDRPPTATKIPGQYKMTNISLKRGFTSNKDVWEWRKKVIQGQTERRNGTITLQDESRKAAITWQFHEGWPSKLSGPALNAKNNEIAIEELEIVVESLERE